MEEQRNETGEIQPPQLLVTVGQQKPKDKKIKKVKKDAGDASRPATAASTAAAAAAVAGGKSEKARAQDDQVMAVSLDIFFLYSFTLVFSFAPTRVGLISSPTLFGHCTVLIPMTYGILSYHLSHIYVYCSCIYLSIPT